MLADTSMEPKSREEHYLNKIAENGGSGSAGYTVTEEKTVVIPEQTVEFEERSYGIGVAFFPYELSDAPNVMYVSLNGQEYAFDCKESTNLGKYYGEVEEKSDQFNNSFDVPSFANYPVFLQIREAVEEGEQTEIVAYVEEPGTNIIKAEAVNKSLEITDDFARAVLAVYDPQSLMTVTADFGGINASEKSCTMSNTVGEILGAYDSGANIRFLMHDTVTDIEYDIPIGSVIHYETSRQIEFRAFTDDPCYILSFKTNTEASSNVCYYDVFTLDRYSGGIG